MCPLTDRAATGVAVAPIARAMQVDVYTAGELVVLKIGDFALSLHFADALRVAYLLLKHGRVARRTQLGRVASLMPSVRAMGLLTNLEAEADKPARWAKKPPELYKGNEILVRDVGAQVELMFRRTVCGLSWDAALTISQHLRVRGKQARNSINEKAPWAEIAGTH